jgi:tRNA pseudouridine13 synthase
MRSKTLVATLVLSGEGTGNGPELEPPCIRYNQPTPSLVSCVNNPVQSMDAIMDSLAPAPLLTADLPGIGGQIKQAPEDFEVEEIAAYEASGTGNFLYLWVEKRAMGAEYFTRQLARRLGIPVSEIGTAGLKDRHAVTRQWVSVPAAVEDRLREVEGDGIRLLRVTRHTNKLKPGHLHGNRFRILIRDPDRAAGDRLGPLLERLQADGLPNYYGPQRFGRDGETLALGLSLLRGQTGPGLHAKLRNPFLRKLALSAAQAALFNHYLGRRVADGLFRRVLPGDVMAKWPFGGLFTAADLESEQLRFDRRETVHTGPIFGRKMFAAANGAAAREAATLADCNLSPAAFHGFGKLVQGTRRHNVVYLADVSTALENASVRLAFRLPAGSYATVVLHEIMKCAAADAGDETEFHAHRS